MNDATDPLDARDWTRGGDRIVYQRCPACAAVWYFRRPFCPRCGDDRPMLQASAGRGIVEATTLVARAPDDTFRAVAPYRLVLVRMDEGFRVMAHADPGIALADPVDADVRTIAGRVLPCFVPRPPESS